MSAAHEHAAAAPPRRRGAGPMVAAVSVVLIGAAGWAIRARSHASAGAGASAGGGAAAAGSAEARPVSVTVSPAALRDVPIYLDGLGSVQPLSSVAIKTQVDGRLDRVTFDEGQTVHKGDVIAQIDPRPFTIALHQAEAALARDAAQLRNAKLNVDRYTSLRGQSLIPQQQLDDQTTAADQLEASIKADQAQVDNARLQLDYARIKSPIDGVTGVRLVDPGNVVHANDATGIVVITQLDPIGIVFTLPEDDLPRVSKVLGEGPVVVEAFTRDGQSSLGSGKLLLIDNQVNQATATIRLKATFANPARALWPSAFVKVRLLLETKRQATVIPAAAVQRGPQGTFVYVVAADRTASMRPVEIASNEDQSAIVARGLGAGDQVVVDGQNQLRPGAKVAPRSEARAQTAPEGSAPTKP